MYRNTNNPEKESRSSSSSESFVVFGTAFPETTEKDRRAGRSDAGQFVPVWKQEARDEQGRRRFHGAFTGGFSAGYFNTVGSKEGWEPSNFVSSRSARNERKEAKPEDYMDEEDLQDLVGARKLVATEEFDILGGTERELAARKKLQEENSGGFDLLGSSLMGMIGPPKDSVGIRLLRKMGWRPGQGIGPRTTRRHKEEDEEGSDEDDDFDTTNITFAPRDTPIENFQAKKDTYGLGYDLLSSVPEVAEMKRLRELARQKGTNAAAIDSKNRSAFGVFERGADAFGLGAFDEHDGEEDDVYGGHEPSVLKNYHHSLYDENESGYTRDEIKAQQGLKRKRQTVSDSTNNKKCSDGRPPLNGFIVSDQKQQIGKWHAPPKVPIDFTGLHITKENTQLKAPNITRESVFSFEERGDALGEKPIETRSVFDYMPQHSKDKLDQAVSWFIDLGKDKSQLSDFPTVPKDVANLALRGFMPFGDNLKKQARYKNYLENQAGRLTEDGVPKLVLPIPEGLTYETGMKETDEFAKAARIFRPISAMMSGRFTSASETTKHVEVVNFEGGLKTEEQYRKEKEQMAKQMPEPEKKQLSQEAEAAAMNMFGSLTRTVKPFYPNRLVCKRFNVRNPHPNHDPTKDSDVGRTQAGSKDALSKEAMESLLNERLPLTFTSASASASPSTTTEEQVQDPLMNAVIPKPSDRKSDDKDEAAPTTGIETANKAPENDDEDDGGAPLDYERPSMDIFKAIFDDSDDEEEEEEEQEKNKAPEISVTTTMVNAQDDDEFIGPPAPPQPATVDISIERSNSTPTATTTEAPFRPMFKRASERREQAASMDNIVSEEVVVQPFKPRSSAHKRRHVSLSDDDDEEEEEDDERERSRSRHHKSSSSSRHHKSSKKSSSRKRSKSRDRSSRRRRSRSPTDHKGSSRHKKSKSSSKSTREHHHHRSSSSRKYKEEEAEHEFEGMWVEKEPVVIPQQKKEPNSSSSKKRMKASDMW